MQESIHPISGVMQTALENIKDMIDVNTVVGEPMVTGSGSTVIPVSKVSFGFVAGGGEYNLPQPDATRPFAGGSGAGVSMQPVGFLVLSPEGVHMLPAQNKLPLEHTVTMIPKLIGDLKELLTKDDSQPSEAQKSGKDSPPCFSFSLLSCIMAMRARTRRQPWCWKRRRAACSMP